MALQNEIANTQSTIEMVRTDTNSQLLSEDTTTNNNTFIPYTDYDFFAGDYDDTLKTGTHTELFDYNITYIPDVEKKQPDWLFGLIILTFFVLGFVRNLYPGAIKRHFTALYSKHMTRILQRESNPVSDRLSILLTFSYVYNFSLILFVIGNTLPFVSVPVPQFLFFIGILGVNSIFITSKYLLVRGLSYVFNITEQGNDYLHNLFLFNKAIGLVIIPFILIIPYVVEFLELPFTYAAIIIVLGLFVLRIISGIQIFIQKQFSIFYMILYLCTLEFLPLLLLYKYLIENVIL